MKILITFFFIVACNLNSIAQTIVDPRIDDAKGMMQQVIELKDYSTKDIHDAIVLWIKKNYVNPNEVIVVNDSNYIRVREHVDLNVAKNVVDCYVATEWDIKDGKVRITISQYECIAQYGNFNALISMRNTKGYVKMGYSAHHNWVVNSFDLKASGITETLKTGTKKDDW